MQLPALALGFAGQALFAARTLHQWIASERAGRSVVPRGFFETSLLGSLCVVAYAALVRDPVFLLAALPQAFVYARNLLVRRAAARRALLPQAAALATFVAWAALARPAVDRPLWTAAGIAGSLLWSGRFVLQWWVSERRGAPTLPASFWVVSLLGSVLLLAYAIHRKDPVMIAGYALSPLPPARNLALLRRAKRGKGAGSA